MGVCPWDHTLRKISKTMMGAGIKSHKISHGKGKEAPYWENTVIPTKLNNWQSSR